MNEYNAWQISASRPRAKLIVKMRRAKKEWGDIARHFSISRQRAQEIYKRETTRNGK